MQCWSKIMTYLQCQALGVTMTMYRNPCLSVKDLVWDTRKLPFHLTVKVTRAAWQCQYSVRAQQEHDSVWGFKYICSICCGYFLGQFFENCKDFILQELTLNPKVLSFQTVQRELCKSCWISTFATVGFHIQPSRKNASKLVCLLQKGFVSLANVALFGWDRLHWGSNKEI